MSIETTSPSAKSGVSIDWTSRVNHLMVPAVLIAHTGLSSPVPKTSDHEPGR